MALRERDRRALKWAGAAAVVFVLFEFAILPLWDDWRSAGENLAVQETTLRKYRSAVASLPLRSSQGARWEQALQQAEEGLLTGRTPATASAELEQWVKEVAARQDIEIRSTEFLPPKPLGEDYLQVPLNVQFLGRTDSFVNFLRELDASPKALLLTRWAVMGANDREKKVSVTMTVAGIMHNAARDGTRSE